MKLEILESEVWYGISSQAGIHAPFDKNSVYKANLQPNKTGNQAAPLLLSNHGRYIWGEDGFVVSIENGIITLESSKAEPVLLQSGSTLKEAYLDASSRFFPPSGKMPPEMFFTKPQYNTWIELMYKQNEADVLTYAEGIVKNGMPVGILMIDDGWNDYYGKLTFSKETFPNPKEMMNRLHEWGFTVMFWVCPFITADTQEFRYLSEKNLLVKKDEKKVKIVEWWNGYSAVLDLSNPDAVLWLKEKCDYLVREYGVDGFKFDAGDGVFYSDEDVTFGNITGNEQASLWNEFGLLYPFNEFRASYRLGNQPLVQRLADKNHNWGKNGVSSLVPNSLAQGILGFNFICPDMIGGGSFADFLPGNKTFEPDLMLRYCAASALMPMMQFSAAPWRLLDKEDFQAVLNFVKLHDQYMPQIIALAENAAKTGEPMVRYLEYEFPHQGLERITDQFMLGSDILVAPIINKNESEKTVRLPEGEWRGFDGKIYKGGLTHVVQAGLPELPYFEVIK